MDPIFAELGLDVSHQQLPRYIAIEGCIGVGKTTLAKNLAQLFNYDMLLENPEQNPFLEKFYRDPKSAALATQLHFLFQRAEQMTQLEEISRASRPCIADFLLDKDQLFARTTLDDDELSIYQKVYERTITASTKPDLVIYLQAPLPVLSDRIRHRGVGMEQDISQEYLAALNEAYMAFFHYYDAAPLLIVNAQDLNLASNREHFKQLVEHILTIKTGRHYYNPIPAL